MLKSQEIYNSERVGGCGWVWMLMATKIASLIASNKPPPRLTLLFETQLLHASKINKIFCFKIVSE